MTADQTSLAPRDLDTRLRELAGAQNDWGVRTTPGDTLWPMSLRMLTMAREVMEEAADALAVRQARTTVDREALADTLRLHLYIERGRYLEAHCWCGDWTESVQQRPIVTWSDHVADAVLARLAEPALKPDGSEPPDA